MFKLNKLRKTGIAIVIIVAVIFMLCSCSLQMKDKKMPVKVLILPKFEAGELAGDFPGEAQYFYEEYLAGGDEFEINGVQDGNKLYYKDGVCMFIIGQGKVSAALSTSAVLLDERFDFSEAYILSIGCGGTAIGYGIPGDVFVISAAVDYDLGHQADPRDLDDRAGTTWFHDESYDESAFVYLDPDLTECVYDMVKNVPLETTEKTADFLKREFPGEAWAQRQPQVMLGTSVTGDNYWKGIYDHDNAVLITETYDCTDPFAVTEMEDVAVGVAVKNLGMIERLIILRAGVNVDVFPDGVTPEMLWGEGEEDSIASENSLESLDIFETAMKNYFNVGKVLIDGILEGTL